MYRSVEFPMGLFPHGKATGHDGTRLADQFEIQPTFALKPKALQPLQRPMAYGRFALKHPAMAELPGLLESGRRLRRIIGQELTATEDPPTDPFMCIV
jgi:hypothetical protein